MATDKRALHYTTQGSRIILKDGLLYRQYFGETEKIRYLQMLLSEQLVYSFINTHHGMNDKHPGIKKVMQQCREKYYFPGLAARITRHISHCMKYVQTKRTDNRLLTHQRILRPNSQWDQKLPYRWTLSHSTTHQTATRPLSPPWTSSHCTYSQTALPKLTQGL